MSQVLEVIRASTPVARGVRIAAVVIGYAVAIRVIFAPGVGPLTSGISAGALYGLIAVGLILIYRTNRIINFAVAAIGAFPAVLATLLVTTKGVSYWLVLPIVLLGGPLIGALVDITIIRRFAHAPRLIVTVATIGVAQVLAFVSIYLPIWLNTDQGLAPRLFTPFSSMELSDANGSTILTGDYVVAVVVVVVLAAGLAAFFRLSRMGIALRASAENADRASLLGIPVRRVGTVAWALAGLFGAVTIFLRAPLVGVPTDGTLGYQVLLFALAPAVIARMESIPIAVVAGLAVGVLEFCAVSATGSNDLAAAIMLVFILGALLAQRASLSRALDTGVSTWKALTEFRPVPTELRRLPEVTTAKVVLGGAVLLLALLAPNLVTEGEIGKLTLVPLTAMVAVSLVILSGWAGQVSLGQFAIVGVGAVTAAKLYIDLEQDFFVTLIAGALVGAAVAVLIGLPALRIQGLFLAVATLSLAGAMQNYVLKPTYGIGRAILPSAEGQFAFTRPVLWERIDLAPERNFYYLALVFLALAMTAAWSFRRHRSGRVLISTRDNVRGAQAYGINLVRTRLAAFAVSGAIAATSGVLFAFQLGAVDASEYGIGKSIEVFVATVIGGLTSLPGAVAGAVLIRSVDLFGEQRLEGISFLVTGPGLLLILLLLPGGFAQGFYQLRDAYLRWVANRHDILVPSLIADRRVEPDEAEADVVVRAEERVESADGFDVLTHPTIACPVCEEVLALEDAPQHPHLTVGAPA
jgi:branched-chain amino acid transport system permease protein